MVSNYSIKVLLWASGTFVGTKKITSHLMMARLFYYYAHEFDANKVIAAFFI